MRLFLFFLATCISTAFATDVHSQSARVSIRLTKVQTKEIINRIEAQTDYLFVYNSSKIDLNRKVSVAVTDKPVSEVLDKVFENSDVTYAMRGNNILLLKKEVLEKEVVLQDRKEVSGRVVDVNGEPLIGANVMEKGTTNGVITDMDGRFILSVRPDAMLDISYIGYLSKSVSVKNSGSLTITLKEDAETLDEVVVVGYGSQKKVSLTGAVASVKMDDVLGNRPVGNAAQILESAVPGLQISRNNGKPGVGMNMNIRGVTSTNDEAGKPLVLVDNVPMDLDMIDPNDIDNISVLKDAASAAIYGARAAYGIVLVTTKKGAKDTPITFNYSNNFAFSNPGTLPVKVSPYETLEVYKDLGLTSHFGGQNIERWLQYMDEYGNGMHPEGYVMNDGVRYSLASTDAYKNMMDKSGFQQQHNLSMAGGSKKANYRLAFGMVDEDGILYGDKDTYQRYNVSSFINLDATDWLSGQLDVRYSESNIETVKGTREGGANIWTVAHTYQPMAPLGYGYAGNDETGELLPYFSPRNMLTLDNPQKDRKSDTRILGRVILKPVKNLVITGEYSFYRQWASQSYSPMIYNALLATTNAVSPSVAKNYYKMENWFSTTNAINIYGTYDLNLYKHHHLKLMVGFNQEAYHYEQLFGKREDLIDQNLPSLSLANGVQTATDSFKEYALRSGFFRINYDYKGRYLLDVNGRYDGSSRFAKENRFGFFPSFSAGWRLSEEPFIEPLKHIISNIKPRISWGSIGNQNVSNYGYLATMLVDTNHDNKWILPGGEEYVMTVKSPNMISSRYTWETVETLDLGIDLGLFNNQLQASFDWYRRDTKNMLAPYKTAPSSLGTSFPKTNSASLRTNGWELTVSWNGQIGKEINYNLGFNLYDSQSRITRYDNAEGVLVNDGKLVIREGMKYGEIWGFTTDRFYTKDDFDANGNLLEGIPRVEGVTAPKPGDILYIDYDENGTIDAGKNTIDNPGDKRIIGNNTARYQYSFNGGISWKDFDLTFLFGGIGKRDLEMPGYWMPSGTFTEAVYDYQMDYWKEDRQDAFWPRLYGAGGNNSANQKTQTKYLRNGAFLRLKNVTIGYNLPKTLCSKVAIKKLRIFVSGENLYTWHHLPKGYNPDAFVAIPGNLKMSSSIQGDGATNWSYPLMRQFSFGLNLTF